MMNQILVSPFDNFFLFTIESQMNGMLVATDLSIYREAYLTFKDNEDYAVRAKSSPLFGLDSARQGQLDFTLLSYDAKQARKIKQKSFLISVIRDYPDASSDETVIYAGTWDLFEKTAEINYNALSGGIETKTKNNTDQIVSLTIERVTLEAAISALEAEVTAKESEKSSLETILNANLAKLSSLKTSGNTVDGKASQNLQTADSTPSDVAITETDKKANVIPTVIERSQTEILSAKRRGVFKNIIYNESSTNNFK